MIAPNEVHRLLQRSAVTSLSSREDKQGDANHEIGEHEQDGGAVPNTDATSSLDQAFAVRRDGERIQIVRHVCS
jgi:hypothetical protein